MDRVVVEEAPNGEEPAPDADGSEVSHRPVVSETNESAALPDESGERTEPAATVYIVQRGDTLSRICHEHGVKLSDVRNLNPGMNPRYLEVGQTLLIPATPTPPGTP